MVVMEVYHPNQNEKYESFQFNEIKSLMCLYQIIFFNQMEYKGVINVSWNLFNKTLSDPLETA